MTISLMVGCSITKEFKVEEPKEQPVKRESNLFVNLDRLGKISSLSCVGKMYSVYTDTPLKIAVRGVKDAIGVSGLSQFEIPRDMTDMAINSISKMGGNLELKYYPTPEEVQMFYYYMTPFVNARTPDVPPMFPQLISKNGNLLNTIILSGAVTEFDRGLNNDADKYNGGGEFGGGEGQTNLNASLEKNTNYSRIVMEFNAYSTSMNAYVNKASSVNSMTISNTLDSKSIGIGISGNSIGYITSLQKVEARHAAIRLLVELGLIEVMGKIASIPYWRCLPGGKEDVDMIEFIRKIYQQSGDKAKLFTDEGYGVLPSYEKSRLYQHLKGEALLRHLHKQLGVKNPDIYSIDTYVALYVNVPFEAIAGTDRNLLRK